MDEETYFYKRSIQARYRDSFAKTKVAHQKLGQKCLMHNLKKTES